MKISLITLAASLAALTVARALPSPAADLSIATEEEKRALYDEITAVIPRAAHELVDAVDTAPAVLTARQGGMDPADEHLGI